MPKSQTPQPANIANLKESASEISEEIMLFFTTLLSGLALPKTENCVEAIRRKAEALDSDVVYNVSRGNIRPWKNLVLGLGLSAITDSKLVVQILNQQGHCINYSDVKALETEFAYSVVSEDQEAPDGIRLRPNLSTACVWDNNDANIETLDAKPPGMLLWATPIKIAMKNVAKKIRKFVFEVAEIEENLLELTVMCQNLGNPFPLPPSLCH